MPKNPNEEDNRNLPQERAKQKIVKALELVQAMKGFIGTNDTLVGLESRLSSFRSAVNGEGKLPDADQIKDIRTALGRATKAALLEETRLNARDGIDMDEFLEDLNKQKTGLLNLVELRQKEVVNQKEGAQKNLNDAYAFLKQCDAKIIFMNDMRELGDEQLLDGIETDLEQMQLDAEERRKIEEQARKEENRVREEEELRLQEEAPAHLPAIEDTPVYKMQQALDLVTALKGFSAQHDTLDGLENNLKTLLHVAKDEATMPDALRIKDVQDSFRKVVNGAIQEETRSNLQEGIDMEENLRGLNERKVGLLRLAEARQKDVLNQNEHAKENLDYAMDMLKQTEAKLQFFTKLSGTETEKLFDNLGERFENPIDKVDRERAEREKNKREQWAREKEEAARAKEQAEAKRVQELNEKKDKTFARNKELMIAEFKKIHKGLTDGEHFWQSNTDHYKNFRDSLKNFIDHAEDLTRENFNAKLKEVTGHAQLYKNDHKNLTSLSDTQVSRLAAMRSVEMTGQLMKSDHALDGEGAESMRLAYKLTDIMIRKKDLGVKTNMDIVQALTSDKVFNEKAQKVARSKHFDNLMKLEKGRIRGMLKDSEQDLYVNFKNGAKESDPALFAGGKAKQQAQADNTMKLG